MNRLNLSILDKMRCIHLGSRTVCEKINQVNKRGSMLTEMITDKDKRKGWYFHILKNTPKSKNVFEKVHKPHKRQNVLNSLFIQNITDVLSTGDVAPEILGWGIEITGVKVSPCCRDLNVYWQIPPSNFTKDEDIALLLNLKVPKIRAELTSRNVLGRVPRIYFIRDTSNAYLAAFEKALEEADSGPEDQASVVPDDTFTTKKKKMYSFKSTTADKVKETALDSLKNVNTSTDTPPPRPHDMKSDVFGLNHELFMKKIHAVKSKSKSPASSCVIVDAQYETNVDLFSKIPGTTFQGHDNREELLKQFHIQRKILRNKKDSQPRIEDHMMLSDDSEMTHEEQLSKRLEDEDFIEEDSFDRF